MLLDAVEQGKGYLKLADYLIYRSKMSADNTTNGICVKYECRSRQETGSGLCSRHKKQVEQGGTVLTK